MDNALKVLLFICALVAGVAGFTADTYLNVEYVMGDKGTITDGPVLTTIIIAIMSSIALASAILAWTENQKAVAVLCFCGLCAAILWSAPVSLARIAQAIDSQKQTVGTHNQKVDLLKVALKETTALRMAESKKGGCGKNCRALIDKETTIRNQLIAAGTAKEMDAGSNQISYFIPWLEPKTVSMVIPVAAVLALTFLMNGLVAVGFHGVVKMAKPKPKPVEKPVAKAKPKRRRKRKPAAKRNRVPEKIDYSHPILETIAKSGEISIGDLASAVGNSHPYVSSYTSELEDRGVVERQKQGRKTIVRMAS